MYWTGDGRAKHKPSVGTNDASRTSTDPVRNAWEWAQDLCDILKAQRLPNLQALHFTDCGLTDIELDLLGPALWRQRNLLSIGLRRYSGLWLHKSLLTLDTSWKGLIKLSDAQPQRGFSLSPARIRE